MMLRSVATAFAILLATSSPGTAQMGNGDTKADAERAVQAYLALWSRNDGISAESVSRFYAPQVVYYGKSMSRAAVLADKKAYIRLWPVRHYTEVPGSFSARCNADRSLCRVSADMIWRRISRTSHVSQGRAHLSFDFVPADGGRKIARESARLY